MASQDEYFSEDEYMTELLSKLISDAHIEYELENIPPEMLEDYDGPLLDDYHYCTQCTKKYKHRKHLNRHKRTNHQDEICQGGGSKRTPDEKENVPPAKKRKTEDQVGGGVGSGTEEIV
jgi:hypothetical protein